MLWYYEMEKPTSMEDLCGTVCQHLTAYVKFVWVVDRISRILLKRSSAFNNLAIPGAEKTVSEANNFFLLAFVGVPSLTSSPHIQVFQRNTG